MILGTIRPARARRGVYLASLILGLCALWMAAAVPASAQQDSASGERNEVVVCNEANGNLVTVSTEAISQGTLDFPFHVATEAERAANGCGDDGDRAEVVVCNEANGNLLTVSQDAVDQGTLDFPFHMATQAEVAAGECGNSETGPSNGPVALPNTGSGTGVSTDQPARLLAVTLMAIAGMLLMSQRRMVR